MLNVNVIPNTVLMLITWTAIESTGGSPIQNITIQYRVIDDKNLSSNWITLQIDPSMVRVCLVYKKKT